MSVGEVDMEDRPTMSRECLSLPLVKFIEKILGGQRQQILFPRTWSKQEWNSSPFCHFDLGVKAHIWDSHYHFSPNVEHSLLEIHIFVWNLIPWFSTWEYLLFIEPTLLLSLFGLLSVSNLPWGWGCQIKYRILCYVWIPYKQWITF